jgi:protein-tyrosine-phosphatase
MDRTVVFVCAHGAARSRIAAAWFNTNPPPGWHATAAVQEPAPALNPRAEHRR